MATAKGLLLGPNLNDINFDRFCELITKVAEEENTELVDQQGPHGHGYGLESAYEKDLGSTKATLAKEIKRLQLHGEILDDAISARDYLKLQRLN